MANGKVVLKSLGLVLGGFVIGAILIGGPVARTSAEVFKSQHYIKMLCLTNTASMIRGGREHALLKNIESTLRQSILSADLLWGDDEDRLDAFWFVQRYYEKFGLPVPEDIQPILDRLPPQPPRYCPVKRP